MNMVTGVGIRGDLVTVKRRLFRNKLYPAGLAVYASPENIERFKKDEVGINPKICFMIEIFFSFFFGGEKSLQTNRVFGESIF